MKNKKLGTKFMTFVLSLVMVFVQIPSPVVAAESSTPVTRTKTLDVSKIKESTDMLNTEGWKWVPSADGGILTLRNFHIVSDSAEVLTFPNGNVTIMLEGENTFSRKNSSFNAMVGKEWSEGVLNLTIAAGTADGKLNILRPDTSIAESNPYGFASTTLTIKSGSIYSNTDFCLVLNDFSMEGGSLVIDSPNITDGNGVYSAGGNINVSGGNIDINTGVVGLYIAGNLEAEQKISITGGNVKIRSGLAALYGKNITISTSGALDLQGGTTALYCSKEGGTLEIVSVGNDTILNGGKKPYLPEVTSGGKTVIIHDADYTEVNKLITEANALNPDYFTTSLANVEVAVADVVQGKNVLEQKMVNAYATAIKNAIDALKYKDADYSKVDEVIKKVPDDLRHYTEASVKAINEAINAVVHGKNISEQAIVDSYVKAIESALAALKYKDADYTKVDEALAKIPADLSVYLEADLKEINAAKNAVVRGKNISEQAVVDGYAKSLEAALAVLKTKPVISITNPETGAKVEYVDGTLFESNILLSVVIKSKVEMDKLGEAVNKKAPGLTLGGLYDVKLLKEGVVIQPSGMIKVSIPLTDAMKTMTDLQVVYIDDSGNVTIIPSIIKDGKAIFITDHFSYYGIIGKQKTTTPDNNVDNAENSVSPETGDSSALLLLVLAMVTSSFMMITFSKKRKMFEH
ncbi:hypothetical protein [Amedibacillus sp. YH-ame10]